MQGRGGDRLGKESMCQFTEPDNIFGLMERLRAGLDDLENALHDFRDAICGWR